MSQARDKKGQFISTNDPLHDSDVRRKEAEKLYGFNFKNPEDFQEEMIYQLEKARLLTNNKDDQLTPFGFTKGFLKWIGLTPKAQNYYNPPPQQYLDGLTGDTLNYYTPIDDLWSTPQGSDTVYDYGRIPLSYLMTLASQRLGIVFRACNGTSGDVFRNKFEFVQRDDDEKVVKKPMIKKYMGQTRLWDKCVDMLDFEYRSGLGHLIPRYKGDTQDKFREKVPNDRPIEFESFSAYYMTPINIWNEKTQLDYDKTSWTWIGGIARPAQLHPSRVFTLETRRVEGGLRGLALAELCWTALMCYLNSMYYVLKALSRLGVVMGRFNVDREFPTPTEVAAYTALWDAMVGNNCVVMGKNATFNLENTSGKIGSGLETYLEMLREEISAAWIYPKNQLFGRAEGGGLEGAGALVSKEDYLGSNISVKQLQITNDIMYILTDICKFTDLEDLTLRWNIDLHKTEKTRLEEQLLREQVEVAKINTKQVKLQHTLYKKQIKLQSEMAEVQLKMMKQNPQLFMQQSNEDEENLGKDSKNSSNFESKEKHNQSGKTNKQRHNWKSPQECIQYWIQQGLSSTEAETKCKKKKKKDFIDDLEFLKLKLTYDILKQECEQNKQLLEKAFFNE